MPRRHRRATPAAASALSASEADDDLFDMSKLQAAADDGGSLDAEWARLQELLSGLLDVTVDARFQLEPRHAHASWLVVYLTRVQCPSSQQKKHALAHRIGAVLGAVATLCACAERLRLREREHTAFWTRVLTSQMMARPLDTGDNAIAWFANHTRAREMRLKIHWAERKLERNVLAPVHAFLDSDWATYDRLPTGDRTLRLRRMRVALCVTSTTMTPRDFELLGDVLLQEDQTHNSSRVFQDAIASLEISDTVLPVETLRALASRVYTRARPIDELRLEAIFPTPPLGDTGAVMTPEYAAAFKSVLVAALDASHCRGRSRRVGLSLAYNTLHILHLQALFDALRGATRDLTSLSLKHAFGVARLLSPKLSEGLMKALEAIAFRTTTPSGCIDHVTDGGCELDLSGSYISQREADCVLRSLADRVARSWPLARRALATGRRVTCRVAVGVSIEDDDDDEQELSVHTDYAVVSGAGDGSLEIVCPTSANATSTGIITASDVVQLLVDNQPLVQSQFTCLILDAEVEGRAPGDDHSTLHVCACPNQTLLRALGPRLRFLCMRWCRCGHRNDLHVALAPCARLQSLNLEGSVAFVHPDTQWHRVLDQLRDLTTLNLNATRVTHWIATRATHWMVEAFLNALADMPWLRLQHLSLVQNQLQPHHLPQFQLLLDVLPSVQLLELDSIGRADDMEDYIAGRRDLARDYHGVHVASTPLSPHAKRAFLSVVHTVCAGASGIETVVLRSIFEMAEAVVLRQILWRGSKQT